MVTIKDLKKEYKNNISDGLNIYYSKNRPAIEIISYLKEYKPFISEISENILLSYKEISKKDLIDYEIKPIDLNINYFNDSGFLFVDYFKLFDSLCMDLNLLLNKYKADIKHIAIMFNNCITIQDYKFKAESIYKEYMGDC